MDLNFRSSHPKVFLKKSVLKICRKFTEEHPYRSVISIKLQINFVEIALRHRCSLVNLPHIFRTYFPRNTSGWLLLKLVTRGFELALLNFNFCAFKLSTLASKLYSQQPRNTNTFFRNILEI